MKPIDLSGQKFGRLEVVERAENSPQGQARWRLQCDCGGETVASSADIRAGSVRSCGCLRSETLVGETRYTWRSWQAMKCRCYNPKHPRYHRYGGRGIVVCRRWHTYKNFLEDMGERPEGFSIDRIDNNGNYEPMNCRWASSKQQAQNRSYGRVLSV